jgi:hypothetical protein
MLPLFAMAMIKQEQDAVMRGIVKRTGSCKKSCWCFGYVRPEMLILSRVALRYSVMANSALPSSEWRTPLFSGPVASSPSLSSIYFYSMFACFSLTALTISKYTKRLHGKSYSMIRYETGSCLRSNVNLKLIAILINAIEQTPL